MRSEQVQKCPHCGFNTVAEHRVRDENGLDRGSQSVCGNCNSVIRDDVDILQEDFDFE